ncbi:hypothetical protein B1H19_06655 [Streptomyces gilvosporeus]|uniref:Uncharacterized protein n=1 Tax=Streptomyces gilvosporeus TaxID=553510 RepID=A0A1V0TLX4_9ACTN|nr:hypothetical protein B1H19_06655 [Streptomyces gilvosporeus]
MDYCSSCRRNLNGALVCPGCGDYAPDIAPTRRRPDAEAAGDNWDAWPAESAPEWTRPEATAPIPAISEAADAAASEGAAVPAATGQGRAARRRQLARWKKYRRRAAAATAFALIGGGLSTMLMQHRPTTGHAQAAGTPEPATGVGSAPGNSATAPEEQPDDRASRHPGARPTLTAGRAQHHTTTPTATTPLQPHAAATAHPVASPSAPSHTAAAPAAHTDHAAVSSSHKTPQASSGGSGASGGSAAGNAPTQAPATTSPGTSTSPSSPSTDPNSPTHLCVLGLVCVN